MLSAAQQPQLPLVNISGKQTRPSQDAEAGSGRIRAFPLAQRDAEPKQVATMPLLPRFCPVIGAPYDLEGGNGLRAPVLLAPCKHVVSRLAAYQVRACLLTVGAGLWPPLERAVHNVETLCLIASACALDSTPG